MIPVCSCDNFLRWIDFKSLLSFLWLTKFLNLNPWSHLLSPNPRTEHFPAECGNGQDPAYLRSFEEATDGVSPLASFLFFVKYYFQSCSVAFFTPNGLFFLTFPHRERYLGTLLQVEGMLKTWFPHIAAQKSSLGSSRHQLTKVRTYYLRKSWGNNQRNDVYIQKGAPAPIFFRVFSSFQ